VVPETETRMCIETDEEGTARGQRRWRHRAAVSEGNSSRGVNSVAGKSWSVLDVSASATIVTVETRRTLRWQQDATNLQLQGSVVTPIVSGENRQGGAKPRSRHGRVKVGALIPELEAAMSQGEWTLGSTSSGGEMAVERDSAAMSVSASTTANLMRGGWTSRQPGPKRRALKGSEDGEGEGLGDVWKQTRPWNREDTRVP